MTMTPKNFLWTLLIGFASLMFCLAIYIWFTVAGGIPSLQQLENPKQNFATRVISADGKLLDNYFVERRIWVPYDSIPQNFFHALISTEDVKFYDHWGVHLSRIFQAAIKNVLAFRTKEGASTITQQLARNLFYTQEATLSRKLKEAFTAMLIEKTYTKEEILEMYANTVNFGKGAFGIQVAAQVYFNKPATDLTLGECAFLVGLLKRPEFYNGSDDYDVAINRRNYVLYLMEDAGYLSEGQRMVARKEPLNFVTTTNNRKSGMLAPHFVEMVRQELRKNPLLKDRDLYRDGLIVYTTLDSKVQELAQQAVDEHFKEFQETFNRSWNWGRNQKLLEDLIQKAIRNNSDYASASDFEKPAIERSLRNNYHFIDSVKNAATTVQVGLNVIDPSSGAILAMIGSSPKFMNENKNVKYSLNHAAQIQRQPGSSFKPFVYASALEQGLDPNAQIECGPFSYSLGSGEVWSPKGSYSGSATLSLRQALQLSVNTVSARLITQHTSPMKVIDLAKRMGVKSNLRAVPALALGAGGEVTPLEMTAAYGAFVNEGIFCPPFAITRIEDQSGNVIYEKKQNMGAVDALSPKIAQTMVKFMQGTIDGGTGSRVRSFFTNCQAAGKTGTTNDFADAWFIGYTPQLVAGIWVGFDDRRVTFTGGYGYAGVAAAPLWGRLMAKIYANPFLPYKQRSFSFSKLDSATLAHNNQEPVPNDQQLQEGDKPAIAPTEAKPTKQTPAKTTEEENKKKGKLPNLNEFNNDRRKPQQKK